MDMAEKSSSSGTSETAYKSHGEERWEDSSARLRRLFCSHSPTLHTETMSTQPVDVVILTGDDLGARIGKVRRIGLASTSRSARLGVTMADSRRNTQVAQIPIPRPLLGSQDMSQWMQCTLKNETQFKVLLLDTHFEYGQYWIPPSDSGPFSQMTWSGRNNPDIPPPIASLVASTTFRLLLGDNNSYDISFVSMVESYIAVLWMLIRLMVLVLQGWSKTFGSTYEAGVVEGIDGDTSTKPNGEAIVSTSLFEGNDEDGNTTMFKFQISAAPSLQSLFIMKQVPV
jgi:hypothetical protein